jgi:EmrB/QacA subfamily drug resistance transporter
MRRWVPVIVLACAQFVMVLDSTVMNVSVSAIVDDLDTTVPNLQLAIASYTLVMAALMLVGAALGDRWGRRRAFSVGLVVYASGSLVTALAPSFPVLFVGWCLLEGLGAVLVVPAVVALVASSYTGRERAVAFGVIGGVAGAAAAAGPLIGGWVTSTFTWRLVFLAEVVIVVGVLAALRFVPPTPPAAARGRFDVVGAGLSAVGLGLVVYALVRSSSWGWVAPRQVPFEVLGFSPTVPLLVLGAAVLVAFLSWEAGLDPTVSPPLVDPALLGPGPLRSGLAVLGVQQFVLAGTFFALPLYLQMVLGLDAFASGKRIVPLSLAVLLVSFAGGRLSATRAPRTLVTVGLATTALGVVLLVAAVDVRLRAGAFAAAMTVLGVGVGLLASQLGNVIQSSVAEDRRSEAGGLQGTAQNLGASLGTALIGAVLLGGLASGFSDAVAADPRVTPPLASAAQDRARQGLDFVTLDTARRAVDEAGLTGAEGDVVIAAYSSAQLQALKSALGAVALVSLGGLVLARRLPTRPLGAAAVVAPAPQPVDASGGRSAAPS